MRYLILVFLVFTSLFAKDIKIATYNVQNLFDLTLNGNEYKEYIPNTKSNWNKKNFDIKINHIAKVISGLNADIIALEEIENLNTARLLNNALKNKKYPYIYTFFQKDKHFVGSVVFSRYKVANKYSLRIKNYTRGIDVLKFYIDYQKFTMCVNHWPAFKHGLKSRETYAMKLKSILNTKDEFVLLGDFNAPYKVRQDNWGKSLTQVLDVGNFNKSLYDLWYELPPELRYTHVFGRSKNALDHIILSKNMFSGKNIEYKPKSFGVFRKNYLIDKYGYPKRWLLTKDKKNLGIGYSDHLPIYMTLQTKPYDKQVIDVVNIKEVSEMHDDLLPAILKDVEVVRVENYSVTIDDGEAQIKIYLPDQKFEKGKRYDILVKNIGLYDRRPEIKLCRIIKQYKKGEK